MDPDLKSFPSFLAILAVWVVLGGAYYASHELIPSLVMTLLLSALAIMVLAATTYTTGRRSKALAGLVFGFLTVAVVFLDYISNRTISRILFPL